jgi:phosphoglycerol transferase MdoB-like AlkP superfamily enzyme
MADSAAPPEKAPLPAVIGPTALLALGLAATKAVHWRWPQASFVGVRDYIRDLAASTHADVLFALGVGACAALALRLLRGRPRAQAAVFRAFLAFCAVCLLYAVASVRIFRFLRSPLTYPLLYLAGDMGTMRSSIGSFVDVPILLGFLGVPALFFLGVAAARRYAPAGWTPRFRAVAALAAAAALGWIAYGRAIESGKWRDRDDRLIAANPHWVIAASLVNDVLLERSQTLSETFPAEYLMEFEGPRTPPATRPGYLPKNVVVVVLESTGQRYLGLYGSRYDTTPRLAEMAAHALVFDNFYSHVGLSANALAAVTLSVYPYMTWREYPVEYPRYPGTTLAQALKRFGFRTALIYGGDLSYTNQRAFLSGRGFDELRDSNDFGCTFSTSWGCDDRYMADDVLRFLDEDKDAPFFVLAWTSQTHHPYEPSPDQPTIDFFKDGPAPPDAYDLGRYLHTVREADRQIGRILDGLRERGRAEDTLFVVTGDHGEGFGEPHPTWGHGARLYQENVAVPLLVWNPRLYPSGARAQTIGGHVDLNATVAHLLGVPPAASWEGRSLFDPARAPRAYFFAANDDYLLGVREGRWKYIFNATRGRDTLYDLERDPEESRSVADQQKERCQDLRQRLAAWRDYVGRQLAKARTSGS